LHPAVVTSPASHPATTPPRGADEVDPHMEEDFRPPGANE
jgi:hypothetical protein